MNKKVCRSTSPASIISAVFLAVIILLSSVFAVQAIENSKIYMQSRFLSNVFSKDSGGLFATVTNPKRLDTTAKFIGAVTAAYIDFEMIPVNEASTFLAVIESINDSIDVEHFSYSGKNLTITGYAANRKDYFEFFDMLNSSEHFSLVTGQQYVTHNDVIRFEIECRPL